MLMSLIQNRTAVHYTLCIRTPNTGATAAKVGRRSAAKGESGGAGYDEVNLPSAFHRERIYSILLQKRTL